MMKKMSAVTLIAIMVSSLALGGCQKEKSKLNSIMLLLGLGGGTAPVLNDLAITATDAASITLEVPTFATEGNPAPEVNAYIGVDSIITVSGSGVANAFQGPIDLSAVTSSSYTFNGLSGSTLYRIVVVARNSRGYSVKEITQSTGDLRPVLNDLVIIATDLTSITLARPTFSAAGNPLPTVEAYIGLDGAITVSGITVSNYLQGPVDVSGGGHIFSSLSAGNQYRIIVVARNIINSGTIGYSVKEIVQSTASIAPVMNSLVISGYDAASITLARPTFTTAGNPFPTVEAYIGLDGTIAVSGTTVTGFIEGHADVSTGGYQFSGLSAGTTYRIIAVARNVQGSSVQQAGKRIFSATATRVYGQDNFTTNLINGFQGFWHPIAVATDSDGVYIADEYNNRVVYYAGTSTTATRVYGGGGSVPSADSLFHPTGVAVDSSGVYIADKENNRVLYYAGTSTTATRVYGQGGDFTTNTANKGGVSANSLYYPTEVAVDSSGVYIVDQYNERVLYYPGVSTTATRVYGQGGDFTTQTINKGGVSADSLYSPTDVAVDSSGVYIADYYNCRVLYYPGTGTTAARVYGQGGDFTTNTANKGGLSADSLYFPSGVAVDSSGVYIVDQYNHRVLYYAGSGTTATRVYGQGGDFTTNTPKKGGLSADSLYFPSGVAVDSSGVYIADNNNRILYYPSTGTTATRVYGQGGNFTTGTVNAASAGTLYSPSGIAVDGSGVYIADEENNRVLYYAGTSTTATRVYGQGGDFTTYTANKVGINADSLQLPFGVAVDSSGVYIADEVNNRVLYYAGSGTTATRVYGQGGDFTTNTANKVGISAGSLNCPRRVAVDSSGVYIADYNNNRVLFYPGTNTTATRVYGQGGDFTTNTTKKGGISTDSLSFPGGVAVDSSGVYIADNSNNRVLYYPGTSTTATRVYGQGGDFTTAIENKGGVSADSLYYPSGVAVDSSGVYIADTSNNRVLYYSGASTTATRVFGQDDFTANSANKGGAISAGTLDNPSGVAVDNSGLYIVDLNNNRVLWY